jgi:hypothetical protein
MNSGLERYTVTTELDAPYLEIAIKRSPLEHVCDARLRPVQQAAVNAVAIALVHDGARGEVADPIGEEAADAEHLRALVRGLLSEVQLVQAAQVQYDKARQHDYLLHLHGLVSEEYLVTVLHTQHAQV